MTNIIGQTASATPSKPAVNISRGVILKAVTANTAEIANAIGQAKYPAIFILLREIISHIIGVIASKNITALFIFYSPFI